MNDEPLDEYGCVDCIHDDEEDHAESCYKCSWLMGEGKGYPFLFQPKDHTESCYKCSWLTPAVPEPKKPFTEKIVDAVKGK